MSQGHDAVYKAMADEHRRKILTSLCRESLVAGELAQLVGLAPNALSFHLKWLKSAGLVSVVREGRFLRYRANPSSLQEWAQHIQATFTASPSLRHTQRRHTDAALERLQETPRNPDSNDNGTNPAAVPLDLSESGNDAGLPGSEYAFAGASDDDTLPTELL